MLEIEAFKQSLEAIGHTSSTYVNQIKAFDRWLNGRDITRDSVYEYLIKLKEANAAARSMNIGLAAIRAYCRFKQMAVDLPKGVKKPDIIHEWFTFETLTKELIPAAQELFKRDGVREKLLMLFWFYTGLRREELATLRRSNIDLDRCTVTVVGKGGKARTVPLPKDFAKHLDAYFFSRHTEKTDIAFNVGYGGLYYRCKQLSTMLSMDITPHTFRRSCAIYLLDSGMTLPEVQEILGHASIETTVIYLKRSPQHLVDRYQERIKYKHK